MKTSTKSRIRKSNKVPAQTYGLEHARNLRDAAYHIEGGESGEVCRRQCSDLIIPADIYQAEPAHRSGVVTALRELAARIDEAGVPVEISLCAAPAGLPIVIARDVLYVMRAVLA